jgi:hypothetical protein
VTTTPSRKDGLLVVSATNNDSKEYPTSFDLQLDRLVESGEWDRVESYTTGTRESPGVPIGAGIVRPMVQNFMEAGETRAGLTTALGDLLAGRYRVRMLYMVNVVGYDAIRPEPSAPIYFDMT